MPVSIFIRAASGAEATSPPSKEAENPPGLTFDGSRIVIGRGPGCDVRLPEVSVSHRHASIRAQGADYVLVDEGSTNGTAVGGVRLSTNAPRALRTGDLVRVGRVWLEVRIDQKPPTRDLAGATRDIALALVANAMDAMGDDIVPKVRVVEGRDLGAVLALAEEGRVYVAGRGADTDLPIEDAEASREHLQIVRRGNAVLVRDLGSKNPSLLGEAPMPENRDVVWRGQTVLRVGRTVLALEEPVAVALAELERAEDEPFVANDTPPPSAPGSKRSSTAPRAPDSAAKPAPAPAPPAAPVAVVTAASAPARVSRRRWTSTDFAVLIAALAVIAMSAAGLYWLLKP
jgi:pSer/pThr/pTyr-binding forkhead associated (FHA) protein